MKPGAIQRGPLEDSWLLPEFVWGLVRTREMSHRRRSHNPEYAAKNDRIIISADADFDTLPVLGELTKPSFVFLRSSDHLAPDAQVELVLSNLENLAMELARGAIVTFAHGRLQVRSLPVSEER